MSRPNLLFLFTDEQRADTMAAYGNDAIDAPNLNRLASESVVFEKSYCTQSVCTPSRSSIMTGLWPHSNGCVQNNVPLDLETPCISEMADGYNTGYFGKWHLGDEIFAQHGFDTWVSIEDMYIRHYREHRDKAARSSYHHWLVDRGYRPRIERDEGPGVFSRRDAATFREEDCKPAFLAGEVNDWLRQQSPDKPFMAYVNFLEPHMPFTGPRDSQYPVDEITLPPNFNHRLDERNHLRARMIAASYAHRGSGNFSLDNEASWRRLLANYWGLVSQVDAAVGDILAALEASGLADNTIIVYTSDHGDMMGCHGLLAKTVMFEEAVKVPMMIKAPGVKARIEENPVSQIDLVPTLLDLMGCNIPSELEGQSLKPCLESGAPPEQRDVFIEWNGPDSGVEGGVGNYPGYMTGMAPVEQLDTALLDPVRTVVTPGGWKLNYSPERGEHELYDLSSDPFEMRNMISVSEMEPVVEDLKSRIREWGESTNDETAASL